MDAYKAVITKRDTRVYTSQPIPDDVLQRILQAGRMAGSSKNRQPVRLVVIRDPDWKKEVASCGDHTEPVMAASVAVAVCSAPSTGKEEFDVGRVAQNMMIAAWNEGVASCPTSMHRQECITGKLGLPEGWLAPVVIAFGYPDPAVPMSLGRARRPLDDLVHWEKWGDRK